MDHRTRAISAIDCGEPHRSGLCPADHVVRVKWDLSNERVELKVDGVRMAMPYEVFLALRLAMNEVDPSRWGAS